MCDFGILPSCSFSPRKEDITFNFLAIGHQIIYNKKYAKISRQCTENRLDSIFEMTLLNLQSIYYNKIG